MTFEQLITLEMIVEKGSFKAAAEALHKTQPSLSVAIKKLEEEFAVLLFNRDEYRPTLTEQGKTFYRWAQTCLRTFRELEVKGKELGKLAIEPRLTIVLDPLVQFESVQSVFEARSHLPNVTEFNFQTETLDAGMQILLNGEADFAIAPKMGQDDRIESVRFAKIKMIPAVSKKLLKNDTVDFSWLRNTRQIVVSKSGGKDFNVAKSSRGLFSEGPKCFVSDHALKRHLILNGFGWGRLATYEVQSELQKGTVIEIKHDSIVPIALDLHIMRSKVKPMGPVAKMIWEQLLQQCDSVKAGKKRKS
ncbi:LysR family transcriptional regulator [Bdellovibrio sp. ArHS]|uniref:LysR family transcriptional regulator n=1 Tax=Bdellovibrio sp. ArHS TaxID=1569284 RepID=UPI000A5A443D|nr:LysR family transcriptional regulator [Bdellovibrio sp. ArHS]